MLLLPLVTTVLLVTIVVLTTVVLVLLDEDVELEGLHAGCGLNMAEDFITVSASEFGEDIILTKLLGVTLAPGYFSAKNALPYFAISSGVKSEYTLFKALR